MRNKCSLYLRIVFLPLLYLNRNNIARQTYRQETAEAVRHEAVMDEKKIPLFLPKILVMTP